MLTDGRTNERTEIWTPISHPAISRCDKKIYSMVLVLLMSFVHISPGYHPHGVIGTQILVYLSLSKMHLSICLTVTSVGNGQSTGAVYSHFDPFSQVKSL